MSNLRANRLTGLFLVVLGVTVTAVPVLFPSLLGDGDNGLLVAPVVALIGLVLIYANRPTRRGRTARARAAARRSA